MEFYCLMNSGGPIDDGLRATLYLSALKLIDTGQKYARFYDENGEGGISTKHKRVTVSSRVAGIEFFATIDHKSKTVRCRFLVNDTHRLSEEDFVEDRIGWISSFDAGDYEDPADWWKV